MDPFQRLVRQAVEGFAPRDAHVPPDVTDLIARMVKAPRDAVVKIQALWRGEIIRQRATLGERFADIEAGAKGFWVPFILRRMRRYLPENLEREQQTLRRLIGRPTRVKFTPKQRARIFFPDL